MSQPKLFAPDDLVLMHRPAAVLGVCVVLALGIYFCANSLNASASLRSQTAQAQYTQVQDSIQQIATEEATFVEYIDRYRNMEQNQVFAEEDRLALVEFVQNIRQQSRYFPVQIEIGEQGSEALAYPPEELLPGQPVELRFSNISMDFSSLHEGDFAGLMSKFIRGNGLIMPVDCNITSVVEEGREFVDVAPNLLASCELIWFTMNLNPGVPANGL